MSLLGTALQATQQVRRATSRPQTPPSRRVSAPAGLGALHPAFQVAQQQAAAQTARASARLPQPHNVLRQYPILPHYTGRQRQLILEEQAPALRQALHQGGHVASWRQEAIAWQRGGRQGAPPASPGERLFASVSPADRQQLQLFARLNSERAAGQQQRAIQSAVKTYGPLETAQRFNLPPSSVPGLQPLLNRITGVRTSGVLGSGDGSTAGVSPATLNELVQRGYLRKLNPIDAFLQAGSSYRPGPADVAGQRAQAAENAWKARIVQNSGGSVASPLTAPALKGLELAARPLYAISGAALAASKGYGLQGISEAAGRGISGQDHTTMGDVVRQLGLHGGLAAATGAALDAVAAGGPLSFGRTLSRDVVAQAVEEAALQRGVAPAEARVLAEQAAAKVPANKGLTAGVRGGIPFTGKRFAAATSGRGTAAVSRALGISKATTALRNTPVIQALGKEFVHDFRPSYFTPAQHENFRTALRRFRAAQQADTLANGRITMALRKAVPRNRYEQVVHAIEQGDPSLAGDLAPVAQSMIRDYKRIYKAQAQRNIIGEPFRPAGPEDAKGYFPHVPPDVLEPGFTQLGAGRFVPSQLKLRADRRPLAQILAEDPSKFSNDLPLVHGYALQKAAGRTHLKDLQDALVKMGRPLNPHTLVHLGGGDTVFEETPRGLIAVPGINDKKISLRSIENVLQEPTAGRKFVVINRNVVKDAEAAVTSSAPAKSSLGRGYDKAQGKFKYLATVVNPGFHGRNQLGEFINGWLGGTTVPSFGPAARALVGRGQQRHYEASAQAASDIFPKQIKALQGTVKLPAAKLHGVKLPASQATIGDLLTAATKEGATGQGYIGKELYDLGSHGRLQQATTTREDLARLAAFISGKKKGLSDTQAAKNSLRHILDYGDLTPTERNVFRRLIPFYTFWARNTRLQAEHMLSDPGKYGFMAGILNEAAKQAGYPSYQAFAQQLPDYQQRGIPFPLRGGPTGKQMVFGRPPQIDLNSLTTSPRAAAQDIVDRLSPIYKLPVELGLNYSTFFQQPIQGDATHPNVPYLAKAPPWLDALPGPVKQALGVRSMFDKKSGKMVAGWPAKLDYAVRSFPQANAILSLLNPSTVNRAQTLPQVIFGDLSGLKPTTVDPVANDIRTTQTAADAIRFQMSQMTQQGKKGSPAYEQLSQQERALQGHLVDLKRQRGDVVIGPTPAQGGGSFDLSKVKLPTGGGGTGSFDFSKVKLSTSGESGSSNFDFSKVKLK